MERERLQEILLSEEGYGKTMDKVVMPYLEERMRSEYWERLARKKIFFIRVSADEL